MKLEILKKEGLLNIKKRKKTEQDEKGLVRVGGVFPGDVCVSADTEYRFDQITTAPDVRSTVARRREKQRRRIHSQLFADFTMDL